MSAPLDTVTVLRSPHLRLAKRLRLDGGVDGYDKARTLDAHTVPVAGLEDVGALLQWLLPRPSCCVIRGALLHGDTARGIRRLLHMDRQTGELPTFCDVPRQWLALDIDGVMTPPGLDAGDLAGCGAAALAVLPYAFHGAACIVQATASHNVKPGLRLRLWMWLSRPTWGAELARWLKPSPCDRSVFSAVQAIYTAAPVLAPGVADPMPERLLRLPGRAAVEVPPPAALAPPPLRPPSAAHITPHGGSRYALASLERAAAAIANAGEGNRHRTIVGETCRLARFVSVGLLTPGVIGAVVTRASQQAGKEDVREIEAAIAYGLANPWLAGPLPEGVNHG